MIQPPRRLLALILAASAAATLSALSQPKPPAPGAAAASKPPLESLDDDKLMGELANRGMTGLLDFYFKQNNITQDKQKETLVVISLKHLESPEFAKKNAADRKAEIDSVIGGIEKLLPGITDPQRLSRYAAALIVNGAKGPVNTLEYWGDNPKTQAALNPIAEAIDKILDRAVTLAKAQANEMVNKIKTDRDPMFVKWQDAENFGRFMEYTRAQAAYGLALSYDKAAEKRAAVCKTAIEKLKDFDEEGMTVRVKAQLTIAKLNMLLGEGGHAEAKKYFDKVLAAKSDDPKDPAQYLFDQYQAKYFLLVNDLLNKRPDEAAKGLPALKSWQAANLPKDDATQKGAAAATSMLEYRIAAARADLAKDAETKEKLNAESVAILMDLVSKRPDLRGIIFEQVMGKLPDNPKMPQLSPLLLEALVTRGIDDLRHKTPEKDDAKNIQLAADAAREIVSRKDQPGISPAQVDRSAFFVGIFEERIGTSPQLKPEEQLQNKRDAVAGYLDYVEKFAGNPEWTAGALDNALNILAQLRKADGNSAENNALYDRGLEIGLFKAKRMELAYSYARRRQELSDYAGAKKGFAMVKSDVPAAAVMAKYYQMLCAQQLLNTAKEEEKKPLSDEIQALATELNPMIDAAVASAPDEKAKAPYRLTKIRTVLLAADVARANKNPARVVDVLSGFEKLLPGQSTDQQNLLLGRALFLRVNALVQLGRNDEALKNIDDLKLRLTPDETLATIASLLQKLNEDFVAEKNKDAPDRPTLLLLATQRADLSTKMIEQVKNDPKVTEANKREYLKFDSKAQRTKAELETDPVKKTEYLAKALKTYEDLSKDLKPTDSEYSAFQRLIALTEFEIGDPAHVQKAHDVLNTMFVEKRLGLPMFRAAADQDAQMNDVYWEALLRLEQSKVKLAAASNDPAMLDEARRILQIHLIQYGDNAGGATFGKDFKLLRKEILKDWKPDSSAPATSQPAAAPMAAH